MFGVILNPGAMWHWFPAPERIPIRVFEAMRVDVAHDLGLCGKCDMDWHCHVLWEIPGQPGTYEKLCTVLFHDAVKPAWRLEDVL